MAIIAFLLLAHRDPAGVIAQTRRLVVAGDRVAIHFDARASRGDYARIRAGLADLPGVAFAARRYRCGWGEWSLVGATIATARAALAAFPEATHFYMLSGDCAPIKTAEYAHAFLDENDADFIESFDFFTSGWIRTGFRAERLIYRHWFNERKHKTLFYLSYEVQRRLGLTRPLPDGLRIRIGSQWWCLRRATLQAVMDFAAARPGIVRFFRTTWIPDETFFQTLVHHLVARDRIRRQALTLKMFTDYGMPVVFHSDHEAMLLGQDFLFARKISPEAAGLRARLGDLWAQRGVSFRLSREGPALYGFLAGRGRVGSRFGPRIWAGDKSLRHSHQLLIIVAKKWHVAKRLTAAIRAATDIPAVDYLFNEDAAHLPNLGGIEASVAKRSHHRRALIRLLFARLDCRKLVICLDPHALSIVADLASDRVTTRLLLIETPLTDAYLHGHIRRVGLAGAEAPGPRLAALVPAVRRELRAEMDRLRDLDLPGTLMLDEGAPADVDAATLAAFLGVAQEVAAQVLAQVPDLFAD